MGALKKAFMDEIEQRALFDADSGLTMPEAFEVLCAAGINKITWSAPLNSKYSFWQYLNLK